MKIGAMRSRGKRLAGVLAVAFVAAGSAVGYAAADGSDGSALTSAERAQLDRQISATLATTTGGERSGLNTIVWKDQGATLTFALPGGKSAAAGGVRKADDWDECDSGRTCLWQHGERGGRRLSFYKCKFQKLRWFDFTNRTSSWENHQTGSARSTLYYWTGSKVKYMDHLDPVWYRGFGTTWKNDKADFLRVC